MPANDMPSKSDNAGTDLNGAASSCNRSVNPTTCASASQWLSIDQLALPYGRCCIAGMGSPAIGNCELRISAKHGRHHGERQT